MLISRLKSITAVLLLLLPLQFGLAAERDAIVWLADGVSVVGTSRIAVEPVVNNSGKALEYDPSPAIDATLRKGLEASGSVLIDRKDSENPAQLVLIPHVEHFTPGSVGGRWIGFGGGSAVCILRTILAQGVSGQELGEIIVARQISGGGLFSVGAETYVCTQAATQTFRNLAKLLGMKPTAEEGILE